MRKPRHLTTALAAAAMLWAAAPVDALAGGRHRGGHAGERWDRDHHPERSRIRIHVVHVDACPPPRTWHRPSSHRHWEEPRWQPYRAAPVFTRPFAGGRELLGTVLGGAVGGVVGSTLGKGSGRTAAIVGGTVLGVLVGGSVGRSMDDLDRLYVDRALETVPTRGSLAWQNPDTRATYEVTPLTTYQIADRYCREYTATAQVAGQTQQVYGTACRQPDGTWEVTR